MQITPVQNLVGTARTKDATTFIIEVSSHSESIDTTDLDKIFPVSTTEAMDKKALYTDTTRRILKFETGLVNQHQHGLVNVEEGVVDKTQTQQYC